MPGKWFSKLKEGLTKTREHVLGKLTHVIRGHTQIDDDMLEEIEEILIGADMGVNATLKIIDDIRAKVKEQKAGNNPEMVKAFLKEEIIQILDGASSVAVPSTLRGKPHVVMLVGVNGVGKTTVAGKLAKLYKDQGREVLLAAGDTFRAAAIEQLEIWAKRVNADIVRHQSGADAASVVFDALSAAKARGTDVLIVDTAGRLHTKVNLMEELRKIKRVLGKQEEAAPHEILLVLDATTGQNAILQAQYFNESLGITGIILAKLDGTAKGGIVVAIRDELGIPIAMVGVGEKPDDLRAFDPTEFVEALFE